MDRKNKTIVWLILFIFLTVVFASVATYAYFTTKEFFYGSFDVEVTTKGVDTLAFNGSNDMSIEANSNNFSVLFGKDLTGSASIGVELETTKPISTYCYEMLVILPNEAVFEYSDGKTPELVLNVSRSEDGKKYNKVVNNLDITRKNGIVRVPMKNDGNEYISKITARKNTKVTQYWRADVTLVWLKDVDQTINDNKSYTATLKANRVECN